MNNHVVAEIKIELVKLYQHEKIAKIISSSAKNFTADYLDVEYQKIVSAQENDLPTYRSEYRVIKTLIRDRNIIIYHLTNDKVIGKGITNSKFLLDELVNISQLLTSLYDSIVEIFITEKAISDAAEKFDLLWRK